MYKRVLLKITGEAIQGQGKLFDRPALDLLADEIKSVAKKVQLAIVIGGGNIVRGKDLIDNLQTKAVTADHIGMMATIINALILQDFLEREGLKTRVMTSIQVNQVAEPYIPRRATHHLEEGRMIILAAGTGNPGVTTDTAAILRASDIEADVVMKGTKVDGVYDRDPNGDRANAQFLEKVSYADFLKMGLSGILDRTAVAQAEMKKMPIFVFRIFTEGNLLRAINNSARGSLIS